MTDEQRRQLPESSRVILTYVAEKLRQGFTGTIELDCQQGGIRNAREICTFQAADVDPNVRPRR